MTNKHDTRAHAEALINRNRADSVARWRDGAIALGLSAAVGAAAMAYFAEPTGEIGYAAHYVEAKLLAGLTSGLPVDPKITMTLHGRPFTTGAKEWAVWAPLELIASEVGWNLAGGAASGACVGIAGLFFGAIYRRRAREKLMADRVITGTRVVSEAELARLTASKNPYTLRIGRVTIPPALETRHLAMLGTTGAGKTTVLRQILDKIEARGDAALVWDTSGEFIGHYYDPSRGDVILNPFDERGAYWNPFDEISHPADADRIARHLISETGEKGRDVWLETARILIANILRTLKQEGKGTPQALLDVVQSMSADEMKVWLAHTSSARTFAEDAERATASVLFMLTKAADLLKFLRAAPREGEAGFSFAKYFGDIDGKQGHRPWIFVPRKEDYFEAMKPLMALWLECAASATLGLAPSNSRRVWFLLDEVADLPKVDNLARLLPEGRKFGASVILTFQAIGQMHNRYGREQAEAMLGCCNSKLFLQLIDEATRTWASDTIGAQEVEIQTISDAIDPETGKPRKTLSATRQTRSAVMESELRLPKHTAFLLLPDGMPVAKISLTDDHIKARGLPKHPRYLPLDVNETLWGHRKPGDTPDKPLSLDGGPV